MKFILFKEYFNREDCVDNERYEFIKACDTGAELDDAIEKCGECKLFSHEKDYWEAKVLYCIETH